MNFGKKEGIVVVGEIQKREIMPLTLELIGAAGKLSKERDLSLSVILSGCGIKEEAKKLYNYGVDEILCIEDEKLIEGHMQLHHDAVIEVLKEKDPKVILIGGTASGRVLAGNFDSNLERCNSGFKSTTGFSLMKLTPFCLILRILTRWMLMLSIRL